MSKSTIHTIKQRLYELHPDISTEGIDFVVLKYFEEVKNSLVSMNKIEIEFLFGKFRSSLNKLSYYKNRLDKILINLLLTKKKKVEELPVRLIKNLETVDNLMQMNVKVINEGKIIRTGKKKKREKYYEKYSNQIIKLSAND